MSGIFNNQTALNALAGGFFGKALVDVTASRAAGVNYTNTTGRPLFVSVNIAGVVGGTVDAFLTDASGVPVMSGNAVYVNAPFGLSHYAIASLIVPANATYKLVISFGSLLSWFEVR